jgi:hypothetical protein
MPKPLKHLWIHMLDAEPNNRPVLRFTRTALVVCLTGAIWMVLILLGFIVCVEVFG